MSEQISFNIAIAKVGGGWRTKRIKGKLSPALRGFEGYAFAVHKIGKFLGEDVFGVTELSTGRLIFKQGAICLDEKRAIDLAREKLNNVGKDKFEQEVKRCKKIKQRITATSPSS